jgi:hypothetical protein
LGTSRKRVVPAARLALAEAVRLDGDVTVNMSTLAFIDAFCARMIADTAKMLAESRTVVLQCLSEVAGRPSPRTPPRPGSRGSGSTTSHELAPTRSAWTAPPPAPRSRSFSSSAHPVSG